MISKQNHEFFLTFESAAEFQEAFERKGPDTGHFFPFTKKVVVGERVWIRCSFKGHKTHVYLEGNVSWRRVRSGGKGLDAGIYVNLTERDRARLDGIVAFISGQTGNTERRKSTRHPVWLSATYETAEGRHESETRNLSMRGAFLHCKGPLLNIGASFPVTLYGDRKKTFKLNAKVAWIDLFEDTKGVGVEFEKGQSDLKQLAKLVKKFEQRLVSVKSK